MGLGTGRLQLSSQQPPPPPDDTSRKMSLPPGGAAVGPFLDPVAPPFGRRVREIRAPAVFSRPGSRTADCGDQPGFGEFLVPPPPLFVGRTIFCAGGVLWMAGPDGPPLLWTPPHSLETLAPACYVALTRALLERARVTKSSPRHNNRQNRLAALVKRS